MTTVTQLIKERFGELTEIQKLAMPKVLAGENILILAPTGNGKTEAVLLPILEKLQNKEKGICALYITPLRALNRDLLKRFSWWCERLEISHAVRHGDSTLAERAQHRKKPPKIMLITVETLQALLLGKIMRQHLANVEFVIVDEIHDIMDNKRGAQLSLGLERLAEIREFQRIGISATVANETQAAKLLFGERKYSVTEVGKNRKMDLSVEKIESYEKNIERITGLVEKNKTLLFVNTRSGAEELGASLKKANAPIDIHHGSLSKEIRISAEDNFKNNEVKSILSTSSLELGIDIGNVELVIQYGSPHQVFRLIQRVGRSGHTLDGIPKGMIYPGDFDDFLEAEAIVIRAKNGWIEDKKVERGALDVIAHQIVGVLLDKGKSKLSDIHKILSRSHAYGIDYEKLRKVALQLYAERILFYDEYEKDVFLNIARRGREYYYSNLSTIPKQKRFAMRNIASNQIIASLDEEFVMNLENGSSFLSKGSPWQVVDITEKEVLAEPSGAVDVAIPEWKGEDIPVPFEIAQDVGKLRKA
ncbi:MAG: DEAD/DEAH box helicase, partial [Candidatus Micrarchaeota archaeon]